jgi:probable O-glycosylation ligase (exosortase A-associated)
VLRDLFVLTIIVIGFLSCWKGPFYSLLFYLWLAYFRPEQWLWSQWVSAGHFSLVVGVIVVIQTIFTASNTRPRWTSALLVLFLAQSLLSAWMSWDWDWSWQWWPDFSKVILIGCLIIVHGTTEKRLRAMFLVIALSLGFEAAKQGWIDLLRHPGAPNMNEHPVLGDNNGVAMGLFMLAPILGALAQTAEAFWEKSLHRFLAVGVILRGLTTYSRGGFLAAGAVSLVYILQSRHRFRTLVVVALLGVATLSTMPARFWDRMETITASDEERDQSQLGRLYFWHTAVEMAGDHPFVGVGFNAFRKAYNSYDESGHAYGFNRAVHSTWFGVLSEMGIPGLLLFLCVLLHAMANCRAARLRAIGDPSREISFELAKAVRASFVVFVVAGSFLNAQYNEMFWHFVCLAAALRWAERDAPAAEPATVPAVEGVGLLEYSVEASHA